MLHIHFSNRLEPLTAMLVAQAQQAGGSVFQPVQVIVPSTAIQRHLTLEMARHMGICANVRFDYLAQWLWQQVADLEHGSTQRPGQLRHDTTRMGWQIFSIFCDGAWCARHPRLAAYLERADTVMRYELAQQVALTLDAYLSYRPDWTGGWLRGQPAEIGSDSASALEDEQWQADLWRSLQEAAGGSVDPLAAVRLALADPGNPATQRLQQQTVHIFALPTLAPLHLALLQSLGKHLQLHLYMVNPCQEYWYEVVTQKRLAQLASHAQATYHEEGNRLLAAWGQQTQASLGQLLHAAGEEMTEDTQFVENSRDTLLAHVQNAVLHLTDLQAGSIALAPTDRSLEVHVCHSLSREIEVLQGRLLGLLGSHNAPDPCDIVVVLPDINAAAPLIDAIFGTAQSELYIPYTITGRARSDTNAPARALLDLLALADSRCTVSAVFGLLQQEPVARRFGLDAQGLDRVREWLRDSGVHWALNGTHRASFGLAAQELHGFRDGLDRLFASYAFPDASAQPFAGVLPAGSIEGGESASLGALSSFLDALEDLQAACATPKAIPAWATLLGAALERFVEPSADDLEDFREVQACLLELARQLDSAGVTTPLPIDLVRTVLGTLLDDPVRGGVPTGRVTFTAMRSLRNLPYAVVCALGLNDGTFPAPARPGEFDLMTLQARPGDRQRGADDRTVFLDLLLAARQTLHLSYVGRSVRDNSMLPPSVLIAELLEYLVPAIAPLPHQGTALATARSRLVVEHPLQPFSEIAFRSDSDIRLRSYHQEYAQALARCAQSASAATVNSAAVAPSAGPEGALPAEAASQARAAVPEDTSDDSDEDGDNDNTVTAALPFFTAPLPQPLAPWHDVTLEQLGRFYSNPCRYLLERRLGLELPRAVDELEDDEPLLADRQGVYRLAQRLLPAVLAGADTAHVRALARAGTELPAGAFGEAVLERELDALAQFSVPLRALTAPACLPAHNVVFSCEIDGTRWHLRGGFADLRPLGMVRWRYAPLSAPDLLTAWLGHLLLSLQPPPGGVAHTVWQARDGQYQLPAISAPAEALQTLLQGYAQGLCSPAYFFARTAWAYVSNNDSRSKAEATWRTSRQRPFAESSDAAYQLALRGLPDPLREGFPRFHASAHAVFDPLRHSLILP